MAAQKKDELLRAAGENRVDPLRQFLGQGGQNEDVRNGEKQTLLHVAAQAGAEDSLAVLLKNPKVVKHIDVKDRAKRTALHLAAAFGYDTCVKKLLEANASLELKDEKHSTPLVLAVAFGWTDVVGVLLKAGADPLVKNKHGANCVEVASKREDAECLKILVEYAHQRKPSSRWSAFLPRGNTAGSVSSGSSATTPGGHQTPTETNALIGSRRQEGRVLDDVPAATVYGASMQALSQHPGPRQEAGDGDAAEAPQEFDYEIEWHGLEPVMVQKGGARTAVVGRARAPLKGGKAASGQASRRPAAQEPQAAAAPGAAESSKAEGAQSRTRSAPPGQRPKAKGNQPPQQEKQQTVPASKAAHAVHQEAPAASAGSKAKPPVAQEFAIFRRHVFFTEQVKRLEFEVEWKADQPRVGAVKPGGAAEQRGVLCQDRIVEIAGCKTAGKGREDLLPLLKERPLLLKIDREEPVLSPAEEPHVELEVALPEKASSGGDLGLDLVMRGQLMAARQVAPMSDAWRAGLLEGDAVLAVNGQPIAGMRSQDREKLLAQRPVLTLWRRPVGMDLSASWSAPRGRGSVE